MPLEKSEKKYRLAKRKEIQICKAVVAWKIEKNIKIPRGLQKQFNGQLGRKQYYA